jgi:hypothetical protein
MDALASSIRTGSFSPSSSQVASPRPRVACACAARRLTYAIEMLERDLGLLLFEGGGVRMRRARLLVDTQSVPMRKSRFARLLAML